MTHTVRMNTNIPDSRMVQFELPFDVPTGEAEVVLVVFPKGDKRHSTGKDLLESGIFGMWEDRTDISDSLEHARELRDKAWRRGQ